MVTTICGVLVIIHSAAISMITVKGLNVWKLKSDINLIAIGYSVSKDIFQHYWLNFLLIFNQTLCAA
ncbi:unnamed protein product [Prunus brigantina]